jgi:type IV secretory pathway TraG/TraD family ATPase VirD4
MNTWGREESYRWPSNKPVWTIGAFTFGVLVILGMAVYQFAMQWTPLERYWFPSYLKMHLAAGLGLKTSDYRLLEVENRQGHRLAVNEDVVAVENAPRGYVPLALSERSHQQGNARLVLQPKAQYKNEELKLYIRHWIYRDQTWGDFLYWPLISGGVMFVWAMIFALPKDRARSRERRYGRKTKGPDLMTAAEFNRQQQSDGIGFITKERRTLSEFLLRHDGKMVRVPRDRESYHFMMMGDTGAGKSSLIRQVLMQVEQRGETAIVYDPALEYTPQFYEPGRGDVILNPLDARMPYWSPCAEVEHEAEAESLAAALFKDEPRSNPFFVTVPRQIFAHLLAEDRQRTPQQILAILRDERELAQRLKDTEHAAALYPEAGPQRGGMIATLNSVANALKLLPGKEEAKTSWTASAWAKQREGWIFITNPPEFRERLRPLISMWLDMLVLRLMNQGKPGVRPAWFILDELHSLHMLPQLHTAITQQRKAKNPVVLGFQGRSQIVELYGPKSEVMLSQPATKIFLRTDEAHSSEWISQTIGKVEIERLRESRMEGRFPNNQRDSRSYQMENTTEPLVMASEIQGLPDLHGYVKAGNRVVRLSFPYIDLPQRHEAFIERKLGPQQLKEEQARPATAPSSNGGGLSAQSALGESLPPKMPPPMPSEAERQSRPQLVKPSIKPAAPEQETDPYFD